MQSIKSTQYDNHFMLPGRSTQVLRHTFELKQQRLEDEVLALGSQVEEMLVLSLQSLREQNAKQAMHLITNSSSSFNQKCAIIETHTLGLLDTEWPTDHDLFVLASILEIALELEHIHEHAKNIAEINLKMGQDIISDPISDLFQLGEMTRNMLHQALKAFADKDLDLARFIPTQHSRVTDLYQHIHQTLLKAVKAAQTTVHQAFYLSHGGHQLERIADRATNICEWVAFSITGEMRKLKIN